MSTVGGLLGDDLRSSKKKSMVMFGGEESFRRASSGGKHGLTPPREPESRVAFEGGHTPREALLGDDLRPSKKNSMVMFGGAESSRRVSATSASGDKHRLSSPPEPGSSPKEAFLGDNLQSSKRNSTELFGGAEPTRRASGMSARRSSASVRDVRSKSGSLEGEKSAKRRSLEGPRRSQISDRQRIVGRPVTMPKKFSRRMSDGAEKSMIDTGGPTPPTPPSVNVVPDGLTSALKDSPSLKGIRLLGRIAKLTRKAKSRTETKNLPHLDKAQVAIVGGMDNIETPAEFFHVLRGMSMPREFVKILQENEQSSEAFAGAFSGHVGHVVVVKEGSIVVHPNGKPPVTMRPGDLFGEEAFGKNPTAGEKVTIPKYAQFWKMKREVFAMLLPLCPAAVQQFEKALAVKQEDVRALRSLASFANFSDRGIDLVRRVARRRILADDHALSMDRWVYVIESGAVVVSKYGEAEPDSAKLGIVSAGKAIGQWNFLGATESAHEVRVNGFASVIEIEYQRLIEELGSLPDSDPSKRALDETLERLTNSCAESLTSVGTFRYAPQPFLTTLASPLVAFCMMPGDVIRVADSDGDRPHVFLVIEGQLEFWHESRSLARVSSDIVNVAPALRLKSYYPTAMSVVERAVVVKVSSGTLEKALRTNPEQMTKIEPAILREMSYEPDWMYEMGLEALCSVQALKLLSKETMACLVRGMAVSFIAPGQPIQNQGEVPDALHLHLAGETVVHVDGEVTTAGGTGETVLRRDGLNTLFGVAVPCKASVLAQTTCHCITLRREAVISLLDSDENQTDKKKFEAACLGYILNAGIEVLEAALGSIPFLAGAEQGFLRALAQGVTGRYVDADEIVMTEGEEGNSMYFLHMGYAVARVEGVQVGEVQEGSVMGELNVLGMTKTRGATVVCLVDSILWEITRTGFARATELYPKERARFEKVANERLENSNRIMQIASGGAADEKAQIGLLVSSPPGSPGVARTNVRANTFASPPGSPRVARTNVRANTNLRRTNTQVQRHEFRANTTSSKSPQADRTSPGPPSPRSPQVNIFKPAISSSSDTEGESLDPGLSFGEGSFDNSWAPLQTRIRRVVPRKHRPLVSVFTQQDLLSSLGLAVVPPPPSSSPPTLRHFAASWSQFRSVDPFASASSAQHSASRATQGASLAAQIAILRGKKRTPQTPEAEGPQGFAAPPSSICCHRGVGMYT